MHESSAPRKFPLGRVGTGADAKSTALRGSSALAICRSLACRTLPGIIVGIGMFVLPEVRLGAAEGRGGSAYVRVVLDDAAIGPADTRRWTGQVHRGSIAEAEAARRLIVGQKNRETNRNVAAAYSELGAGHSSPDSERSGPNADWVMHAINGQSRAKPLADGALTWSEDASLSSTLAVPEVKPIKRLETHIPLDLLAAKASPLALEKAGIQEAEPVANLSAITPAESPTPRGELSVAPISIASDPSVVLDSGDQFKGLTWTPEALSLPVAKHSAIWAEQDTQLDHPPYFGDGLPQSPENDIVVKAIAVRSEDLDVAQIPLGTAVRSLAGVTTNIVDEAGNSGTAASGSPSDNLRAAEAAHHQPVRHVAWRPHLGSVDASFKDYQNLPLADTHLEDTDDYYERIRLSDIQEKADVLYGDHDLGEATRVRLGAVVEMLKSWFEEAELARLRSSSAIDVYLPIHELRAAGIPLSHDPQSKELTLNLVGEQAGSGSGAAGPINAPAAGRTVFSGLKQNLSATASAGFDSNPFLADSDNTSAVSMRLQLEPSISRSGDRSSLRLSGRLEHIEYLGQYDSLQNYGADLAFSHRVNERFEIDGGVIFRSNILATNLANPFINDDPTLESPRPPIGNDITILGQGQRRTQYGADAGLAYALSERDQLRWSFTARADRFGAGDLVESDLISQQFQYERQLDDRFTVGAVIDASLIDFTGAGLDGAKTISPQLQVSAALNPRIEVSGSIGLAVTRLELDGLGETTTALAGNLSLCRRSERSSVCLNGSRQVLPGAIGGALLQTTGGVSFSLRMSKRDTLQLNGNYATASQPLTTTAGDFESINGFVRYERQLDERFRLFASGGILNTSGNSRSDATNFQALVGVTFKLGPSR